MAFTGFALVLVMKLRAPEADLGDLGVHQEDAYPDGNLVGGRIDTVKA